MQRCGSASEWFRPPEIVSRELRLGSTQDQRLSVLNVEMQKFQSDTGVTSRMPPIRLENLTDGTGLSNLNSVVIKAANTRHLVPFIVHACKTYFDSDDVEHRALNRIEW